MILVLRSLLHLYRVLIISVRLTPLSRSQFLSSCFSPLCSSSLHSTHLRSSTIMLLTDLPWAPVPRYPISQRGYIRKAVQAGILPDLLVKFRPIPPCRGLWRHNSFLLTGGGNHRDGWYGLQVPIGTRFEPRPDLNSLRNATYPPPPVHQPKIMSLSPTAVRRGEGGLGGGGLRGGGMPGLLPVYTPPPLQHP
jgi:hypothetical protein